MNTTMMNTLTVFEEKLKGDLQYLRDQFVYEKRIPEKMSAFQGFSTMSMVRMDSKTTKLLFKYEGSVLLHVLLHGTTVSFHQFGLEDYVLNEEETLHLFETMTPQLEELAFYLS